MDIEAVKAWVANWKRVGGERYREPIAHIEALVAEVERLRGVLRFYAECGGERAMMALGHKAVEDAIRRGPLGPPPPPADRPKRPDAIA